LYLRRTETTGRLFWRSGFWVGGTYLGGKAIQTSDGGESWEDLNEGLNEFSIVKSLIV